MWYKVHIYSSTIHSMHVDNPWIIFFTLSKNYLFHNRLITATTSWSRSQCGIILKCQTQNSGPNISVLLIILEIIALACCINKISGLISRLTGCRIRSESQYISTFNYTWLQYLPYSHYVAKVTNVSPSAYQSVFLENYH